MALGYSGKTVLSNKNQNQLFNGGFAFSLDVLKCILQALLITVINEMLYFYFNIYWLSGLQKQTTKKIQCRRHKFNPRLGKVPWRRNWQPAPVLLTEDPHGQRNLVGLSPWGCKNSDMIEQLNNNSTY